MLALTDTQLNGLSSAAPAVLMGLTVASAIHIALAWQAAMRGGASRLEAIATAYAQNARPVVLSVLTTMISFLLLNVAESPPFRQLGNIVALGLVGVLVLAFTLLPALLTILPRSAARHRAVMERAVGTLAGAAARHAGAVLIADGHRRRRGGRRGHAHRDRRHVLPLLRRDATRCAAPPTSSRRSSPAPPSSTSRSTPARRRGRSPACHPHREWRFLRLARRTARGGAPRQCRRLADRTRQRRRPPCGGRDGVRNGRRGPTPEPGRAVRARRRRAARGLVAGYPRVRSARPRRRRPASSATGACASPGCRSCRRSFR